MVCFRTDAQPRLSFALTPAQMVLNLAEGIAPKTAVPVGHLDAYITWLTADQSTMFTTQGTFVSLEGVQAIGGAGVGAPSVLRAMWAIGAVEEAMGLTTNAHAPAIRARNRKLRSLWRTEGAPSFDVVEVLIFLFSYSFSRRLLRRCRSCGRRSFPRRAAASPTR